MWDNIFYVLWTEACKHTTEEAYIQDMHLTFSWKSNKAVNIKLGQLWDLAHANVKRICSMAGLTHKELATHFAISNRVVESWCGSEPRNCKAHTRLMLLESLNLLDRYALQPYFIEDNREQS